MLNFIKCVFLFQDDHRAFRRQLEDKRPVIENNLLSGRQYVASEPPHSDTSDNEGTYCFFFFYFYLFTFCTCYTFCQMMEVIDMRVGNGHCHYSLLIQQYSYNAIITCKMCSQLGIFSLVISYLVSLYVASSNISRKGTLRIP